MVVGRFNHAATLLPDGRMLITGGQSDRGYPKTVEIYDPRTGLFSGNGELQLEHPMSRAALLEDGNVVVSGQYGLIEIYDPGNGSSKLFDVGISAGAKPVTLPHKRILFAGGVSDSARIYDIRANTVTRIEPPCCWRSFPSIYDTVTALVDGSVLVTGGAPDGDFSSATNSAMLFKPKGDSFMPPSGMSMQDFRNAHTGTALPDGSVLLFGGNDGGDMTASHEIFDPVGQSFHLYQSRPERASHTATLLPDGLVLIAGGSVQTDYLGLARTNLSTADLYLPGSKIPGTRIFTVPGAGDIQGMILHAGSSRLASAADPAEVGEALELYLEGLAEKGAISPRVSIGGLAVEVLYFGAVSQYPGLFQVNVLVPPGVNPGTAVPVRINYLDRPSNEVTIAVR